MKLSVREAAVRYGQGASSLMAVDGVDLDLPAGSTVGIVGESGSGKTTLGKTIVGLAPLTRGRLELDGEDYTSEKKRDSGDFRRRVQMVFQDPFSSLNPRMTLGETLSEVLPRSRFGSRRARAGEIERILGMVGLPAEAASRYPHQFSGGQLQRLAIGRALAVGPEVIICDEVTSGLDVSVQAKVLNLLRELQGEYGLSYVFISHDLSTVRYMSDVVVVMYLGRIVEAADSDTIFRAPQHPYTRTLIASLPEVGAPRRSAPLTGDLPDPMDPPSGCRFHTRCPIGPIARADRQICIDEDPADHVSELGSHAWCHFAGSEVPMTEGLGAIRTTTRRQPQAAVSEGASKK